MSDTLFLVCPFFLERNGCFLGNPISGAPEDGVGMRSIEDLAAVTVGGFPFCSPVELSLFF